MHGRRLIASLLSVQRRWYSVLGHHRDQRFARVEAEDIGFFKSLLGEEAVVTDPFDLQSFNRYGFLRVFFKFKIEMESMLMVILWVLYES